MKKLIGKISIVLIFILIISLCLTGCGDNSDTSSGRNTRQSGHRTNEDEEDDDEEDEDDEDDDEDDEDDENGNDAGDDNTGDVNTDPETPETVDAGAYKEVHVTNMDEFIDAIDDNTIIYLGEGTYNVTEWIEAHEDEYYDGYDRFPIGEHLFAVNEWDGYGLIISGVRDMSIITENYLATTDVSLVCTPRYADVLAFEDCSDITLNGFTMGHTIEQGSCQGDVLSLYNCINFNALDMDLYGCGTYGLVAEDSMDINLYGCYIHDCSYGMVYLYDTDAVCFFDDYFYGVEDGFSTFEMYNSTADFRTCLFENLNFDRDYSYNHLVYVDESSFARFYECDFMDDNAVSDFEACIEEAETYSNGEKDENGITWGAIVVQ